MAHRFNNVMTASNSNWQAAASATVTAYAPGGVISSAATTSTSQTVYAGHGFRANDYFFVWDGSTTPTTLYQVTAINSNGVGLTVSPALTTSVDDVLVNVGADTYSSSTVDWDGSPLSIHTEPSCATASKVTNAQVTANSDGEYEYHTLGDGRNWEVIRDSSGNMIDVIQGWGTAGERFNAADWGAVHDDSTDNFKALQTCIWAAAAAKKVFHGPAGDFRVGDGSTNTTAFRIKVPANCTGINDPWFRIVRHWGATNSSTQSAQLVSEAFSTAAEGVESRDDNIWWQGGRLTVSDAASAVGARTMGGSMIAFWSDNGTIKDVVIEEWGDNTVKGFGCSGMGDNFLIHNVRAYSTVTAVGGSDGINWSSGTGGKISNCHCKSADDCYTISSWASGPQYNFNASYGQIVDCSAEAVGGRLVAVHTGSSQAVTATVSDVLVKNLVGTSAGAGFVVKHANASSTATIKNVRFEDCSITVDTDAGGERAIEVDNSVSTAGATIEHVTYKNIITNVTSDNTRTTGVGCRVVGSAANGNTTQYITIDGCHFDASSIHADVTTVVLVSDCSYVDTINNTIIMNPSAPTALQIGIRYGTTAVTGGHVTGNTIIDIPNGTGSNHGYGIDLNEYTNIICKNNILRFQSGATVVGGIVIGGGTAEGNCIVADNDVSDWFAIESAAHTAGNDTFTSGGSAGYWGIIQLNEDDVVRHGNVGHDLVGYALVTASTTQTQGQQPLRAALNYVTTGTEDDVVTLPYANQGRTITIWNVSNATDLQIFPAKGDAIASAGTDTAVFLAGISCIKLTARNKAAWDVVSTHDDVTASYSATAGTQNLKSAT